MMTILFWDLSFTELSLSVLQICLILIIHYVEVVVHTPVGLKSHAGSHVSIRVSPIIENRDKYIIHVLG